MGRFTTFIRAGRTREQEGQIKATVAACSRAGVTGVESQDAEVRRRMARRQCWG